MTGTTQNSKQASDRRKESGQSQSQTQRNNQQGHKLTDEERRKGGERSHQNENKDSR